jgi:hypothetical protein
MKFLSFISVLLFGLLGNVVKADPWTDREIMLNLFGVIAYYTEVMERGAGRTRIANGVTGTGPGGALTVDEWFGLVYTNYAQAGPDAGRGNMQTWVGVTRAGNLMTFNLPTVIADLRRIGNMGIRMNPRHLLPDRYRDPMYQPSFDELYQVFHDIFFQTRRRMRVDLGRVNGVQTYGESDRLTNLVDMGRHLSDYVCDATRKDMIDEQVQSLHDWGVMNNINTDNWPYWDVPLRYGGTYRSLRAAAVIPTLAPNQVALRNTLAAWNTNNGRPMLTSAQSNAHLRNIASVTRIQAIARGNYHLTCP